MLWRRNEERRSSYQVLGGWNRSGESQCPPRASPQALTEQVFQSLRAPLPWNLRSSSAKVRGSLSSPMGSQVWTHRHICIHTHTQTPRYTHICTHTHTQRHSQTHTLQVIGSRAGEALGVPRLMEQEAEAPEGCWFPVHLPFLQTHTLPTCTHHPPMGCPPPAEKILSSILTERPQGASVLAHIFIPC